METKSWRTTACAIGCWVLCVWLIKQGNDMHDFSFHDMDKTIHQSVLPFLAFVTGLTAWHARDHKAK